MTFDSRRLQIDQVLPSLAPRDAIGYHTCKLQEVMRSIGISSEIFADEIKGEMNGLARPFRDFVKRRGSPSRYVIYQASTGSPIVQHLMNRPEALMIKFHNITPKEIVGRGEPRIGVVVGAGVKQLAALGEKAIGAISVSKFNRWCLEQEGLSKNSLVAAPFIPLPQHNADRPQPPSFSESRWLFVGRIAPNKAQHDIVLAFAAYLQAWDPSASLTLVGSISSQRYADFLTEIIHNLGLESRVTLTGPVTNSELEEHYRNATVFVCLSDHEGFGFPIVEALARSVPVVAFSSSAIPETLGRAGMLLSSKQPLAVAAAVSLIEKDRTLRDELLREARKTLDRYSPETAQAENLAALNTLIPEMAGYL